MIQQNISLLAQQDEQLISEPGLHAGAHSASCFEAGGLLALASGEHGAIALEVLQDDMSLNLAQALQQSGGAVGGASQCLGESLDNIHEFLQQKQSRSGVDLGVIQLAQKHFSAFVSGEICGARFRGDMIKLLCDNAQSQPLPGAQGAFTPQLVELDFQPADILLLTTQQAFDALESDFVRLTLARFNDNLHMALRQLNTRAMRNGLSRKPEMLLCRIDKPAQASNPGWFKRR
jgi:hypothetical protein